MLTLQCDHLGSRELKLATIYDCVVMKVTNEMRHVQTVCVFQALISHCVDAG